MEINRMLGECLTDRVGWSSRSEMELPQKTQYVQRSPANGAESEGKQCDGRACGKGRELRNETGEGRNLGSILRRTV